VESGWHKFGTHEEIKKERPAVAASYSWGLEVHAEVKKRDPKKS